MSSPVEFEAHPGSGCLVGISSCESHICGRQTCRLKIDMETSSFLPLNAGCCQSNSSLSRQTCRPRSHASLNTWVWIGLVTKAAKAPNGRNTSRLTRPCLRAHFQLVRVLVDRERERPEHQTAGRPPSGTRCGCWTSVRPPRSSAAGHRVRIHIVARLHAMEANACTARPNPRLTTPSVRSRRCWPQRTSGAPECVWFRRPRSRSRQQKDLKTRVKRGLMN